MRQMALFQEHVVDVKEPGPQAPVSPNPKDLLGVKKVSVTCISPFAMLHEARAMHDGVVKYGPYNWREHPVQARIYLDAAMRHLLSWFEGEEEAQDSGAHHLGHARGCLGILLDAMETGNLVDNRPKAVRTTQAYTALLAKLNQELVERTNAS